MKKKTILFIIVDILLLSAIIYINNPSFAKKLINKEYQLSRNMLLVNILYDDEVINNNLEEKIIIDNYSNDYYVNTRINKTYDSVYDELILSRDKNDDYKVIKTMIGKNEAYIVAIYDPSKVHILTSKAFGTRDHYSGLETVKKMTLRLNASVGINGGGFRQDSRTLSIDSPIGYVIKDSKIVWNSKGKNNLICMTNDNKLKLIKATGKEAIEEYNVRDALQFGPFLIVDGEVQKLSPTAGGYRRAARSIIAQRRDGIILFIVTEVKRGYTQGTTLDEIVEKLKLYDVYNAANLDGGASTQLVVEGKVLNYPLNIYNRLINNGEGRSLVTGWGLIRE